MASACSVLASFESRASGRREGASHDAEFRSLPLPCDAVGGDEPANVFRAGRNSPPAVGGKARRRPCARTAPFLLTEDADREDEADLLVAAEGLTVATMATLIRECSGIVCLCLLAEDAAALQLRTMVQDDRSRTPRARRLEVIWSCLHAMPSPAG